MLPAVILSLALAPAELPEVGKPAPAIRLEAANVGTALPDKKGAKELSLKDLQGKNVVLFFFPKAGNRG